MGIIAGGTNHTSWTYLTSEFNAARSPRTLKGELPWPVASDPQALSEPWAQLRQLLLGQQHGELLAGR